ncbi:MAG TPA: hypothetical protein VKE27_03705 [Candidatus Dormibacteraeota bacterium]|nr:hypothetical protein [Candidatus Dormibacteraeota bacterium]
MAERVRVYVEAGAKRTFASAADWPGWSRSGKDEKSALENLAAYAPRYARVARLARVEFPKDEVSINVIERLHGNATTDFGAPAIPAKNESKPMTAPEAKRMLALLEASWKYLDNTRAKVPEELRKGPRGGGRNREKMYAHVLDAEVAYASAIGLKLKKPDRKALLEAIRNPNKDTKWPVPYAVRRIAWHSLDHAWEMEDRLP